MSTTMSRREQRDQKTTVMVDVLDTAKVRHIAQAIIAAQYGGDAGGVMPDHCVIAPIPGTDDGWGCNLQAVICTEGVGWEQDDRNRVFVPCWQGVAGVDIGVDRLLNECRTGEMINLADHIRTFGDRLEMNFDIWHHRLTVGDTKKK